MIRDCPPVHPLCAALLAGPTARAVSVDEVVASLCPAIQEELKKYTILTDLLEDAAGYNLTLPDDTNLVVTAAPDTAYIAAAQALSPQLKAMPDASIKKLLRGPCCPCDPTGKCCPCAPPPMVLSVAPTKAAAGATVSCVEEGQHLKLAATAALGPDVANALIAMADGSTVAPAGTAVIVSAPTGEAAGPSSSKSAAAACPLTLAYLAGLAGILIV